MNADKKELHVNTHCILSAANRNSPTQRHVKELKPCHWWFFRDCKGGEFTKKKKPLHHSMTLSRADFQLTDCKASQFQGLYHPQRGRRGRGRINVEVHSTLEPGGVQVPALQKCCLCWPSRCSLPPVLLVLLMNSKNEWEREHWLIFCVETKFQLKPVRIFKVITFPDHFRELVRQCRNRCRICLSPVFVYGNLCPFVLLPLFFLFFPLTTWNSVKALLMFKFSGVDILEQSLINYFFCKIENRKTNMHISNGYN